MQQKTSIKITLTVAILIAAVFLIRGTPNKNPSSLATEHVPADESEHIARAITLFKAHINAREQLTSAADGKTADELTPEKKSRQGLTLRGAHPKHHGCLKARFQVASNLPKELTSELFVPGAQYPAWIRFSNNGEPAADTKPDVRGFAIKLFDVSGEKLSDGGSTHDLLLVSHPVFLFDDVETYVRAFDAFGKDHALRFFFNPLNPQIRSFQIAREMLAEHKDLLNMRWWSMVPYQFGEGRAVKYGARPCAGAASKARNYGQGVDENFLKARLVESLQNTAGCYEFMIQFQSDPTTMPIEDPRIEWDETIAPFQPIAVITIPQQTFSSPEQNSFCEHLSFNPWQAIEAHRPLGGISRARREIYRALASFRRTKNQVSLSEPAAPDF